MDRPISVKALREMIKKEIKTPKTYVVGKRASELNRKHNPEFKGKTIENLLKERQSYVHLILSRIKIQLSPEATKSLNKMKADRIGWKCTVFHGLHESEYDKYKASIASPEEKSEKFSAWPDCLKELEAGRFFENTRPYNPHTGTHSLDLYSVVELLWILDMVRSRYEYKQHNQTDLIIDTSSLEKENIIYLIELYASGSGYLDIPKHGMHF